MRKSNGNSWGSASEYYPSAPEMGQKRVLPKSAIRKIQHASSDGGRARCCICNETFSMQYIRYCVVGFLHTDHVCVDCKSKLRLTELR